MNIRCKNCFEIHKNNGACPSCRSTEGGYLQEPNHNTFNGQVFSINKIYVHKETKNQYEVLEFQSKGMVARLLNGPAIAAGKCFYISSASTLEYQEMT